MKALLIGGTGNISLSVSQRLLKQGWELTLLNRGNSSADLPGARHIKADISDEQAVKSALKGLRFDTVCQFIAYTPDQVARDIRLFSGITDQYVFISSASCYQKPNVGDAVTESTPLANPFWQYSRDKIACEDVLMAAFREQGFPVTIVRPSHTYSARHLPLPVNGKMGVWQNIRRIQQGKPVLIPGDGTSLWTITYADDFAVGFCGLLGNSHAIGQSYHITSDEALTWNHIVETVARVLDRPFVPCHVPSDALALAPSYDYRGSLMGDKMWCARFDNAKIKALVPDFTCPTRFDLGARLSLDTILRDPALQREDPAFDHFCDQVVGAVETLKGSIKALS